MPRSGRYRTDAEPARARWMLAALALSLAFAGHASAQTVYRYVDSRGIVHFTNLPAHAGYQQLRITPRGLEVSREPSQDPDAAAPNHHAYDRLIERVGRAYSVDPALVKAVIAAESNFDAKARSRKGAEGLMQLMPETARDLGVEDSFDPVPNVLGGTRYLRSMIDRYRHVGLALAAYNAGPSAVDRYRGMPPYRETRDYVAKVLDYHRRYSLDFRR